MGGPAARNLYRKVSLDEQRRLELFRELHPPRTVAHAGMTWQYTATGEGDGVLVVLPMLMRDAVTLFPLLPELEADSRVIAVSIPPITSVDALVDGVAAVLKQERVNRVALLGIGLGGMLAQSFALRYRKVVSRLILAHTAPPDALRSAKLAARARSLRATPGVLARPLIVRSFLRMIDPPPADRALWRALLRETVARWSSRDERAAHWAILADFARRSFDKNDLLDWRGRILIVESSDDRTLTIAQRKALKDAYPAAHVRRMERGGHAAALTRPVEFASIVRAFLSEVDVHGPVEKTRPAAPRPSEG